MSFATEIAKERFYDQMERYRNLNDGLDLPAGVIPLYLAGLAFFVDRLTALWAWPLHLTKSGLAYLAFFTLTVLSAAFVIWSILDYVRTIWCYQDAIDLPSPKEQDDWIKAMEQYAAAHSLDVEEICDDGLRDDYVTAAQGTFKQNEARSRKLFYCRRKLVISLVLTAMAMVAYYLADETHSTGATENGRANQSPQATITSTEARTAQPTTTAAPPPADH